MFKKYVDNNRNMFVISSNDYENIPELDDEYKILELLNMKYLKLNMDMAPYHFAIINGNVYKIKDFNLSNLDNGYLKEFKDDIRILLINSKLQDVLDTLSNIIATAAVKYSMRISGNILIDDDDLQPTILKTLTNKSIEKRNNINPIFCIVEDIYNESLILNKNIVCVSNRVSLLNLRNVAEKYMVDESVLKKINPHINSNKLDVNDVVFIPNTTSLSSLDKSNKAFKIANYLVMKSEDIIRKAVEKK